MSGELTRTTGGGTSESTVQDGLIEMYCPMCERSFSSGFAHCPTDGGKLIRLVEGSDPLIGTTIDDRFLLKRRLGSGGMGVVYEAEQQPTGIRRAIKLINPQKAASKEISKRFLREAKVLARLRQANTVTIVDYGQDASGMLYLAMELLEGHDLGELLKNDGPLSPERVRAIGIQLCNAMEVAHSEGIVHRDLKPANIIAIDNESGRDQIKVLDFGIAKTLYGESTSITESNMIVGTPGYLAPETAIGRDPDARTDLYSAGIILYELLSGHLPFEASNPSAMLRAHVSLPPRPLSPKLPPKLVQTILLLLEKNPDNRPSTAAETRSLLDDSLGPGGPIRPTLISDAQLSHVAERAMYGRQPTAPVAPAAPAATLTTQSVRPRRTAVIVISMIAASALGFAAVYLAQRGGDDGAQRTPPRKTSPAAATNVTVSAADAAPKIEPPADARPEPLVFELTSEPAGASVILRREGKLDALVCTATPCRVMFPETGGTGSLVFQRSGYLPTDHDVELVRGEHSHHGVLEVVPKPDKPRIGSRWKGKKPKGKKPDDKKDKIRGTFLSPKK